MSRFKRIVLFIHVSSILLCFLSPLLGVMLLCGSSIFLALYLRRFFAPLEKMLIGIFPVPIEKNAFTELAITLNSMHEKIKESKLLSQGQDKDLAGILNALSEGVLAFNVRSKVTFANEKACLMLGRTKQELMGRSLLYFEGFLHKCHELVLHALQTAESINEKWIANGVHYELLAAPLMHQEGAILVIKDRTSDYKILDLGKNFIANASHEIRTPITVIRGFAELLPESEIAEKIVQTCERLDKLVKSLLTITDLENISSDHFKPCHVATIVENCKHLLLAAHPEAKMHVSQISEKLMVYGNFDLLGAALMNILENAVKYSANPVDLKVQQLPHSVRITIEDKGIGIPPSDLPHIFDRFYTVDKARSRKLGGVGLGLSIVKLIMEKHRGFVSAQSEPGKGSIFTLEIPKV